MQAVNAGVCQLVAVAPQGLGSCACFLRCGIVSRAACDDRHRAYKMQCVKCST